MEVRPSLPASPRWWLAACVALAVIALLINPIGYVGGHNDDWRYLEAARCWVSSGGPCLATTHWATRWPTLASIALSIQLLGESRAAVGLAMLPWWIAAVAMVGWLGRLWIDRTAGLTAAAVLAATPVVTQSALEPNVDLVELALQLAALIAATWAYRRRSRWAAILGGGLAALAVQSRDTSLLFCAAAAVGWLMLPSGRRAVLLWALAGFGVVMAAELAVYGAATGDALFRYKLALAHGTIPTDELPAGFDLTASPLFNPAYIAQWRREMGIEWWWPLDPWLNLLASPRIGFTLLGGGLLSAILWRWLPRHQARLLARAGVLVAGVSLVLVYGLAVDPKPRMFLLLAAYGALLSGAAFSAARARERALVPGAAIVAIVVLGLLTLARLSNTHSFEALAERWVSDHAGAISLDPNARSTLTLVRGVAALPSDPNARPYRIMGGNEPCRHHPGRTIDRSPVIGGGQTCLQRLAR